MINLLTDKYSDNHLAFWLSFGLGLAQSGREEGKRNQVVPQKESEGRAGRKEGDRSVEEGGYYP